MLWFPEEEPLSKQFAQRSKSKQIRHLKRFPRKFVFLQTSQVTPRKTTNRSPNKVQPFCLSQARFWSLTFVARHSTLNLLFLLKNCVHLQLFSSSAICVAACACSRSCTSKGFPVLFFCDITAAGACHGANLLCAVLLWQVFLSHSIDGVWLQGSFTASCTPDNRRTRSFGYPTTWTQLLLPTSALHSTLCYENRDIATRGIMLSVSTALITDL